MYIGHTFIERAVVPEILLAATQTGVTALDRVTGALVPFDDTARVIGARTFASHFIQAVAMLGVLIVEALHEQAGVEIRTAVARIMYSAGVEHLRTAQSVQLRHAFESQHISEDSLVH